MGILLIQISSPLSLQYQNNAGPDRVNDIAMPHHRFSKKEGKRGKKGDDGEKRGEMWQKYDLFSNFLSLYPAYIGEID